MLFFQINSQLCYFLKKKKSYASLKKNKKKLLFFPVKGI